MSKAEGSHSGGDDSFGGLSLVEEKVEGKVEEDGIAGFKLPNDQ